ncbi:pyridoxal phosphate-dependent aminotransferase [Candidatus Bipolaricaulota bacterium]|nr:pyridoxal phosphate-dependent aminotransferase [Candidatus Bipolaricaulota bacterium]
MPNPSRRTAQLAGSPIRSLAPLAAAAKRRGKTVYHLNIGQPDIPTPKSFMDGVRNADISVLSYSPSLGIPETLSALQGYYAEHSIDLSPDEMCVTIGGSEAFVFALQVTTDPGDEVLIPEPFYPNYLGNSLVNGIKVVPITTHVENGFHLPPVEEIEALVTPRTRAILFSNPANPTGVGYTREELERLVEIACKHDLFVISDEPYRELVYDGETTSILSFPELRARAILVDSISKRLSACGARIGVLACRNETLMSTIAKMAQIRLSPPTFSQYGLIAFLKDPNHQDEIAQMVERFRARRDTLFEELQTIPGVICRKPEGAFYIFVKFSQLDDTAAFARWMLTDFENDGETVMVAPGAGFYATPDKGCDEMRLAYVLEEEKIVRAIAALRQGLAAYEQVRGEVQASI